MVNWEEVELGLNNLVAFDYENLGPGTNPDYSFRYITLENVDNGKLLQYINCKFSAAPSRARRVVHKNDLLISTVRPNLHSHYKVDSDVPDVICSTGFCVIKTDETRLAYNFLYSLFYSNIIDKQIELIVTGSSYPAISSNDIKKLIIPLPPLYEQISIATALLDADVYIAALEKLIAKKRAIKQGAMQELLTGKRRLSGFSGEWVEKPLCQIAYDIVMGQSPDSRYYNNVRIGLPLVQGNADVKDRLTIIRFFTSVITKKGAKGDIIMTVRAPVGNVAKTDFDCCLGRGVCAIKGNDFIYQLLVYFEPKWGAISTGSTFDSISGNELREVKFAIPTDENEQAAIATVLSDMDTEIDALTAILNKAQHIKQGMMSELLTGRIRLV